MKQTIPSMTLIDEKNCEGCQENVKVYETELIGGPDKGKKHIINQGCRCEDIRLAKQAKEYKKQANFNRVLRIFKEYSLINKALMQASFETYEPKNESQEYAKRTSQRYVEVFNKDKPNNLAIYGGYGVGKSHLAKSITDGIMAQKHDNSTHYTSIYISVPKLLRKIRSTYDRNSEVTEEQIFNALETADLLVLDDLGAENDSEWAEEKIFDLIDSRQGMSTIYTMNFKPEELTKVIGERNFSRVINQDTHVIEIEGSNHRLEKFKGGK